MNSKIYCIVCDKELDHFADEKWHPINAVHFYSYGHYGSTHFDPMDGSSLNIAVCDDCLDKKTEKTEVIKIT